MRERLESDPTEPVKTVDDFIADGHTPMMAQYHATKTAYPDCLLFYRMGDFYELFYDDAITAANCLDITLTKRGKNQGDDIPMCGVPWHSHESYLAKLIRHGHKVAICEQVETPEQAKARGGHKALVRRDVVRVVTGGTLIEDHMLQAKESNYLCAVACVSDEVALAWLELSTGAFSMQVTSLSDLTTHLERIGPSEVLISRAMIDDEMLDDVWALFGEQMSPIDAHLFDSRNAGEHIKRFFEIGDLEGAGYDSRAEIAACGALLSYVEQTQIDHIPHISKPERLEAGQAMEIDAATRRNLELTRTLSGERKGSLLHAIDQTVSGAGGRMLGAWMATPLCDVARIQARHGQVQAFVDTTRLREDVRSCLKSLPDMERALSRLSAGRGNPRDLLMVRDGLRGADHLKSILAGPPEALMELQDNLVFEDETSALLDLLRQALIDEPPALLRDGNFVKEGYHPKLDELRGLKQNSRKAIAALQAKYQQNTKIDRLKISYNNVLGYFVEVPSKHADPLMVRESAGNDNHANPFIHRQTMSNAVRFTTTELAELERDLAGAEDKALALEIEIFKELVERVMTVADPIGRIAHTLARLDVLGALAELAVLQDFIRPVVNDTLSFDIHGGRHPVVEQALKRDNKQFIANNCALLPDQRLWLLTGPNMAGKSTFLRQNALIAILAQMGSFVPAEHAEIGVVDRVFSRVGASDDLAKGRSTFMVEMVETAAILNRATERSLVILDEIGRGTATFDGLSIAWACVEHLHNHNKSRALFATHYHELTHLTGTLPRLSCHSMQVKEWKGEIVFLHSVGAGAADRSYGIHVAKLAGLPGEVITRAQQVLRILESKDQASALSEDMPLFTSPPPEEKTASPLESKLSALNPDSLSPKEALEILYKLKELSQGSG